MLPYALTIFVSAFLLFQVQPVIAKMILPWFGGSAMVWTCCMLFFQLALLGGYAYSHGLVRKPMDKQRRVHTILLAVSLLWLPIIPKAIFQPRGEDHPLMGILLVLTFSVGLPYFMLATTSPLVQAWYAASHPGTLPYRLFALSNFGSLLALLAYPVLVEPNVTLKLQGYIWSVLYVAFVVLCLVLARRTVGRAVTTAAPELEEAAAIPAPPPLRDKILWVALAACASILLLAVTGYLSQNVAAIPFLWVLPLSLYLLSFMLCFDSDRWYKPWLYPYLLALALAGMAYPFWGSVEPARMLAWIVGFSVALFVACMFCHGEIARRKPHPNYLTGFYLLIAGGGAIGGLLVGVAAPLLLPFPYELTIGLAATSMVALATLYARSWLTDILWAAMSVFLILTIYRDIKSAQSDHVFIGRNFYGSLRVRERGSDFDGTRLRLLINGTISHGAQYVATERKKIPTTYYGEKSGVGVSIQALRHPGMKVGVVGLGAGTLASYGLKGEQVKIYEINPLVVDISRQWFTYTRDSEANLTTVMGDARLSLEREQPNGFDVLAIDAFSSDAIPVHLLTKEAVEIFLRHLQPDGIVAIHVSNKYLNLSPVVRRIAESLGKPWILVEDRGVGLTNEQYSSDWVLVANNPAVFGRPAFRAAASNPAPEPSTPLWTDDYSNLYRILR